MQYQSDQPSQSFPRIADGVDKVLDVSLTSAPQASVPASERRKEAVDHETTVTPVQERALSNAREVSPSVHTARSSFMGSLTKCGLALATRELLSLRYRIDVKGLDQLPKTNSGRLVLPNHPGLIDPVIVTACLWDRLPMRPVVTERFVSNRALQPLMKLIRAISMPNLDVDGGFYKRRRVEQTVDYIAEALRQGDNILMYPSGRLMRSGHESLGGKSGLFTILQSHPDLELVLVRTKGIYGSSFSTAQNGGETPDLGKVLKSNVPVLLKNLLLFSPRRHVEMEVAPAPDEVRQARSAAELNRILEEWYNQDTPVEPALVRYSAWSNKLPQISNTETKAEVEQIDAPPEVQLAVKTQIARIAGVPLDQVETNMQLAHLGIDSLGAGDLLLSLQELGAGDIEMAELTTVASAIRAVVQSPRQSTTVTVAPPPEWTRDAGLRTSPAIAEGSTLQECFLRCAARMPAAAVALADERSGVLTWGRLRAGVFALRSLLLEYPDQNIGIMLPSSVAASMSLMATLLANKTAVMLNWTSGPKNVEHAVNISNTGKILTSRAFLDRVPSGVGDIESKFVFLEDLRGKMGAVAKLKGLARSRMPLSLLSKMCGIGSVQENDPAVILFTSGSEAAPKAVPLSHRNILSNIRAAMQVVAMQADDVLYGFLPPFHSFGLSLCTVLPLIGGLKTALHANPNEKRKLAAGCGKWQVSLMAGTPTFIKGILGAGNREQFSRLRLLISGADRIPADLPPLVRDMTKAELLEGYGITECSPMVTVNRPGKTPRGVGLPLPGVTLLAVDPETYEPMPPGERGLILINGDNVFSGYIGGAADPFVNIKGLRWYNSGDLGYLQEGSLVLAGRMKRFVKIAGEMVSLPQLEDVLGRAWPSEDMPQIAVLPRDKAGQDWPELILFSSHPEVTVEEANNQLRRGGLPPLVRVSRLVQLDELPLLGSGKVDLQSLKAIKISE